MAVRATQNVIASLSVAGAAHTLVTQIHVEAHAFANASARATSVKIEASVVPLVRARATWFALEILVWRRPPFFQGDLDEWEGQDIMPDVYPTLPGLSYSVIKRPKFFTGKGTSQSGREVRYAYAATPLWEWDLTYPDFLPDFAAAGAATPSDFKTLVGFYLAQAGALRGFLFSDPDDNTVTAQPIGTTDGVTTNWTLQRTFGGSDGSASEPVGYIDVSKPFHVYLNGVLQDPSTYDVLTTHPVAQVLKFHVAPAADYAITVDMTYWFYVRFKEDTYDFEKFMDRLWSTKMLTLMIQRG
jgi:uncharacterized protein (TIGR02217 family)